MKNSVLLRALCLTVLLFMVALAPNLAFAQRGGHGGGGGGFHGGGGGFHGGGGGYHGGGGGYRGAAVSQSYGYGGYHGGGYRGGGYYGGGYHGGGYYGGWHGGYYRGGYWGYPGYGWGWGAGWGFGLSFNWGGYWPSYPYAYGYAPYYPYPYYYYAAPAGYVAADPPQANAPSGEVQPSAPATDNLPPAPPNAAYRQPVKVPNTTYTLYRPSGAPHATTTPTMRAASYSTVHLTRRQAQAMRPEVQTAIRALQGMPPSARPAQLSRYASLSPEELQVVRYAADVPSN